MDSRLQEFQRIHPGELHIILWISHALKPQRSLLINLTTSVDFLVFESQRLRADNLHSFRFPNPYGPSKNSDENDIFLEQQLATLLPLRHHLEASNWCFSTTLGALRCYKDTLYSKILLVNGCDPVAIKEVCEKLKRHKSKYSRDALSRYLTAGQIIYGYDDRDTFVEKVVHIRALLIPWPWFMTMQLTKLLYQNPGFCISAYDAEFDDLSNGCHSSDVDIGTPLLQVLSQLVSARSQFRQWAVVINFRTLEVVSDFI